MGAKLVAEKGEMKGLTLSLDEGEEWIIGRDPDACQLLIEDPSASRKHLICRASPEGIIVENLSDTNPVEVNQEKVREPRVLKHGDMLKIGNGIFTFYTNNNGGDAVLDDEAPDHETIFEEMTDEDKGVLAEIDFDLREQGRWLLKVIGGPNNGAEFSMQTGGTFLIGTDPTSCDVVFHDTSVSRQHARISVSKGDVITIEDLKSRNGTLIDGEPLEGKAPLEPNTLVTMGTTSFIVFDREGDMQTIISPLLPSIVKVLQKEDKAEAKEEKEGKEQEVHLKAETTAAAPSGEKTRSGFGAFILLGIVAAIISVVGVGMMSLFQSEPITIKEKVDPTLVLDNIFARFPSVKYSFNNNTGRLLIVGHVLTLSDRNELLYNLQGIEFLKSLDDSGLIVDEQVWRETNYVLQRDNRWKGISVHSPAAGKFVLSGYLETRKQSEELNDYITRNFPFLDLLERRVIVEEEVRNSVEISLDSVGIRNLDIQLNNGELTLTGGLSKEQMVALDRLVKQFREISGIRNVKTFITELEPEQAMMNITNRYTVTGFSHQGGSNLSVVINGRILTRGDMLDGMTITSIRPNVIFLEKDNTKYRIDYNQ